MRALIVALLLALATGGCATSRAIRYRDYSFERTRIVRLQCTEGARKQGVYIDPADRLAILDDDGKHACMHDRVGFGSGQTQVAITTGYRTHPAGRTARR